MADQTVEPTEVVTPEVIPEGGEPKPEPTAPVVEEVIDPEITDPMDREAHGLPPLPETEPVETEPTEPVVEEPTAPTEPTEPDPDPIVSAWDAIEKSGIKPEDVSSMAEMLSDPDFTKLLAKKISGEPTEPAVAPAKPKLPQDFMPDGAEYEGLQATVPGTPSFDALEKWRASQEEERYNARKVREYEEYRQRAMIQQQHARKQSDYSKIKTDHSLTDEQLRDFDRKMSDPQGLDYSVIYKGLHFDELVGARVKAEIEKQLPTLVQKKAQELIAKGGPTSTLAAQGGSSSDGGEVLHPEIDDPSQRRAYGLPPLQG